jgi:hypothetical protein
MSADVEYALRQWLRGRPDLVGAEVHFGNPDALPVSWITLGRVGGAPSGLLDEARISHSAWGPTKKDARLIAGRLVDLYADLESVDIGNGCFVYGAIVDLMLWRPAADTARPRYIVDVSIHFRLTET